MITVSYTDTKKEEKNKLTVTDAVDKYLLTSMNKHEALYQEYIEVLDNQYAKLKKDKKRWLAPLAIIGELFASAGIGFGATQIYNILTNYVATFPPVFIFAAATLLSFGLIEGGYHIINHFVKMKPLKKELAVFELALNQIKEDQKIFLDIKEAVKAILNNKVNDYTKYTTTDMKGLIKNTYILNKSVVQLIKNNYYYISSNELKSKIDSFFNNTLKKQNISDMIKESNQIIKLARTEMKDKCYELDDYRDVAEGFKLYDSLEEGNKLLKQAVMPFTQILNATFDKIKNNYDIEQNELLEKERLKQEKINQEIKRKYEAERKTVEEFFDEFGVDVPNN